MRGRLAILIGLFALALPAAAAANGDPASDILLQAKVYFPTQRVSPQAANSLKRVVQAANAKGYPIRVALIHDESDLGTVPGLLNQPQQYAQFLAPEIRFIYKGNVLVVMPDGLGLASSGQSSPDLQAIAGMKVEAGGLPDGLAQTAEEAVTKLTAAAGHPITATKKSGGGGGGGSGTAIGIAIAAILIVAGVAGAFLVRRNQPQAP